MSGSTCVEVSSSSITRAWKAAGYDDFWLLFRTDSADIRAFRSAVDQANKTAAARGGEVRGIFAAPCPQGFAVTVTPALEGRLIDEWVQDFSTILQGGGCSGRLTGAPPVRMPGFLGADEPPVPTLFAAFTLSPRSSSAPTRSEVPWDVEDSHTEAIVRAMRDWATVMPGEVVLMQNLFFVRADVDDVAAPVATALRATGIAGVDVVLPSEQRARRAVLGPRGAGLFQTIGEHWLDCVDQFESLLTRFATRLDQAFVRSSQRGTLAITGLDAVQPLPGVREHHVRYNRHLLDRYLPDAHGLQVVLDAHLERAHDLTAWHVTDLGNGRNLVKAPDLEPWYSGPVPDPDVLEQGRQDWDGALLSEQVIANHPRP